MAFVVNKEKIMKKSKILIPALGILVLSTTASITGTVAWFSVNNSVTVDGMTVKTQVASNLLIAADTLNSTSKAAENAFGQAYNAGLSATLEPVSSVNGSSFFYTTKASGTGDASENEYTAYDPENLDAFRNAYGAQGVDPAAVGYVDVVFQLKASNQTANTQNLEMEQLELKYGGAQDDNKAYRVAIWVEDITTTNPTGTVDTSAKIIYAPSGAENFSDAEGKNYAVSAALAAPTQLTVNGNVYNNATDAAYLAQVPTNTTKYFKVVARFWIEGEDTTCKNDTFATLKNTWSLNMKISLDDSTTSTITPVSALGMAVTA